MKYIELYTVHFVSTNGITLTTENPRIEATEENIKKLQDCINKNYLTIVEIENEKDFKDFKSDEEIHVPDEIIELNKLPDNVTRIKVYTKEELEEMTKKELVKIIEELGLDIKTTSKVSELRNAILNSYEEDYE